MRGYAVLSSLNEASGYSFFVFEETRRFMSSRKCWTCGLINFANEASCRRCGQFLDQSQFDKTDETDFDKTTWKMSERANGAFMIFCGLVLGYFGIYDPYTAMIAHSPKVSLFAIGAIVSPALLVMGIFYLTLGPFGSKILGHPQKPKALFQIVFILLSLIGLAIHFWLKQEMQANGYQ